MTFPTLFGTPERVIVLAYEDAGITQEGDSPNSEQIARGMTRLNDIINLFCTQGLKLWSLIDQEVTLVDGQQEYTFMPGGSVSMAKPMRILQGYVLVANSQGTKRPIYPLSWDDWMKLSNVEQEGAISQFFVDKLYDRLTVKFWLIPDANEALNTAHLLIQQQITNFSALTEDLMFPPEWFLALRWALADDLATGQPEAIVQRCAARAGAFRVALENWDVEDPPTQFTPDPRIGYFSGQFR
jgi:hypothetical protein